MKSLIFTSCLLLCCGCNNSLEQRADKSERDISSLKRSAKKIRDDAVSSKKELGEQLAKCDEIIIKTEALLGKPPETVVPPKPTPVAPLVPTPEPKPLPVTPVVPVAPIKPLPEPEPTPPEPKPDGPEDGRFEVARSVWKLAQAINSPDLKVECQALAGVFESIGSKVASGSLEGGLVKPQWMVISEALTKENASIIEKHAEAWEIPSDKMGKAIAKFYKDKKLKTNKDWNDLFKEIAVGLRAVK